MPLRRELASVLYQMKISRVIERFAESLCFPDYLAKALHQGVYGMMGVALSGEALIRGLNTRWMVYRQLFGDSQMHGEV